LSSFFSRSLNNGDIYLSLKHTYKLGVHGAAAEGEQVADEVIPVVKARWGLACIGWRSAEQGSIELERWLDDRGSGAVMGLGSHIGR
jgi:hypothetical protein